MAIFNNRTTPAREDLVAVFDANGNQVFRSARPIRSSGSPEIKYMTHPQETGGNTTDHRIILPNIVSMTCIIQAENYRSVFSEIEELAESSTELTVQTKARTYEQMRITSYPDEDDPSTFDTITVEIVFREVQEESAQTQILTVNQVANPADSSTVNRGQQQVTTAQPNDQTLAQRIFSNG